MPWSAARVFLRHPLAQASLIALLGGALAAATAHAQGDPSSGEGLPGAPSVTQDDARPARTPSATSGPGQRVEITGARDVDVRERRDSTAAKIVVGREEIERFGDSTLAEVLKRLPGVTAPGGGRGIRMRGLGAGYTQILIDGERMPPGFSLESLNPEQVERIEILRAPTAETGTRAMAGTINIITREGFVRRLNDLHLTLGTRGDKAGGGVSWTRNGGGEAFNYNLSLSAMRPGNATDSVTTTTRLDEDGSVDLQQREHTQAEDRRTGVHATARLQWRLGQQGDTLMLMPFLMRWEGGGHRESRLQTVAGEPAAGDPVYGSSRTDFDNRFTLARVNAQLRKTLPGGARLEGRAGISQASNDSHDRRREFGPGTTRFTDDDLRSQERSGHVTIKATQSLGDGHNLVAGLEAERSRREESARRNGLAVVPDADTLVATVQRAALYGQDEWNITPTWAAHVGLRWEGIETRSDVPQDEGGAMTAVLNRSSVFTPVLHAVWKLDEKKRDQVRLSLTRSYKAPTVQNLVARPRLADNNSPTRPDRVGNPALRPELATGLDLAFERYLSGGGVLSANVFHRRIQGLIRSTVEEVDGRFVSRPVNLGKAITQGVELEAKFRLPDLIERAPAVDLRANASVYRSKVAGVPGPDNRLDQQAEGTLNLGADYRVRGTPLALGGSFSFTPGYATQISDTQRVVQSRQRGVDAYAVWTFSPTVKLRVSGSNLAPVDEWTASTVGLQTAQTVSTGFTNWQLRLELKT